LPPHDERARLAAAVAGTPRDPAPRRALAAALARAGELDAALDQYRELLALVPDDPAAAAEVGLIGCRTAREEEVLPSVRAAATAHPDHARVWQVLGLMHRALEDLEPAIEAFDRAAGLVPRDPSIAHGRARACFEAGQPSVGHYETLRRLVPGDKAVLLGLAAALIAEGRSDEAVTSLEAELERDPTWATGHAALARHLWAMGEGEAFTASFEKALHRYPRSLDLWRELIVALIHTGAFETALEAIARGRAAAGPHPLFEANEAACQAELGRYDEADALFARVAPLRDPTIMGRHIRHLLRTGRPAQAERIALSMSQTPLASEFFPYLAIAWRMTGNPLWQWLEGDPRLVGVYDLADILPSLEELAERLRALHVTLHQPLEQSLRGGTQTDGFLLLRTEPAFRALRAAFVEAVRAHVAQLPPPDPRHPQLGRPRSPIRFCGSWSVRLTSGGCHANHFHPEGWFSSAFYVSLPEPADRGPEPAGWLKLGEPQAELHLDLPPIRLIEPKPGRLVLFPSTMWHGTRPFESGERLTVAFDVAPQSGPAR
jgi:Flp pilus assembly protein TadD